MRLGSAISFISLGFPPAPRTLGANGWCLPLPAALPWLCLCCQRKGRAQELGGSIQAVAMDGCCSPSREGSRLPAGNTLVSAWREGADLASAGVSTEAPGTWQCTHAVRGVGTVCHPNTAAATSQPLSHPECLDVPRGHQHKMDVWLPNTWYRESPCPGWGFWCFVPTSLVTLGRYLPGPKLEKHHLGASHHLSVLLGACVCDQSLHMRLGHHTAHSWAPGVCKESGQGSGFRVF